MLPTNTNKSVLINLHHGRKQKRSVRIYVSVEVSMRAREPFYNRDFVLDQNLTRALDCRFLNKSTYCHLIYCRLYFGFSPWTPHEVIKLSSAIHCKGGKLLTCPPEHPRIHLLTPLWGRQTAGRWLQTAKNNKMVGLSTSLFKIKK